MRELLPTATVTRPKLGIHEGSGTSSAWSQLLRRVGVAESDLASVKTAMAAVFHRRTVREQEPPGEVSFDDVLDEVMSEQNLPVTRRPRRLPTTRRSPANDWRSSSTCCTTPTTWVSARRRSTAWRSGC